MDDMPIELTVNSNLRCFTRCHLPVTSTPSKLSKVFHSLPSPRHLNTFEILCGYINSSQFPASSTAPKDPLW
nr:unnamed protein product [Haemonchus contortus]